MEFVYEEATKRPGTSRPDVDLLPAEFTREYLIQLLLYVENEVKLRDSAIEQLKEQRSKLVHFEARYAKLCPGDPFHALSRDDKHVEPQKGETTIEELLESHQSVLEMLIAAHQGTSSKFKMMLLSAEKRLGAALNELAAERVVTGGKTSMEYVARIEEERDKLKNEVEKQAEEAKASKKELKELDKKIEADRDRHQKIVLYLMNERKEMLGTMAELQLRKKNQTPSSAESSLMMEELRRELAAFRTEKETLRTNNKMLKGEVLSLKDTIRAQEEEILTLRRNMGVPMKYNNHEVEEDRSLVVANRVAMGVPSRTLSSSSSFPTEKSRLPRAPSSPSRPSTASLPKPIASKKPSMGLSTVRRVASSGTARVPPSEPHPLDSAIDSLQQYSSSPGITRSGSLTRGRSEPRPLPEIQPRSATMGIVRNPPPGPNVAPPPSTNTRLPAKSDPKILPPSKSKSLLRAFGK